MGYMTTIDNVQAVIDLIKKCFCNKERELSFHSPSDSMKFKTDLVNNRKMSMAYQNESEKLTSSIKLQEICIYPIKSCAPYRIDSSWTINRRGLKYDREWMIVHSTGVALTQKTDTKLCMIKPTINEAENTLTLSFPYVQSVKVPLRRDMSDNRVVSMFRQSKVCGDRIDGIDCGDEAANWLDDILCSNGLRLIQQNVNDKRTMKTNATAEQAISLSNQAQFLLINVASVDWLAKKVEHWVEWDDVPEKMLQNTIDRFRANLIVESKIPLEESEWKSICIGDFVFTAIGPCTRCQMICIDQSNGHRTTEPLQTIAREFGGKMRFGIYLCQGNAEQLNDIERTISCDDCISIEK